MRLLLMTLSLFFLGSSGATAATASLDITGNARSDRSIWCVFDEASDVPFEFVLDAAVDGPCRDVIGPLTGRLVIDGHEDGTFSLVPQLFQSNLRGGMLHLEDAASGNVVLEAVLGTARIYEYGEFAGTFLEGTYAASLTRDISSTCELGELRESNREFTVYAQFDWEQLESGQWAISIAGALSAALVTSVPTQQNNWGVLKARY
jgi:hypothetical protein